MERSTQRSSVTNLLASLVTTGSHLVSKAFARSTPQDPDLDQIFNDQIEREMMYRELHCR